jgi:hypothetical protein
MDGMVILCICSEIGLERIEWDVALVDGIGWDRIRWDGVEVL